MSLISSVQNFLLGSYEEDDDQEIAVNEKTYRDTEQKYRAPKTDNITRLYPESEPGYKIILTNPKNVDDTSALINNIRANNVCVINLDGVEKNISQRIADILGGAAYFAGCTVERISNGIFIIAPNGVNISGKLKSEIKNDSSIFPWVASR